MAQKRVYFPDIDREYRNIRYTIQTQALIPWLIGAGEFLGAFFGAKKNAEEAEELEQIVQQQQQQIQQLQTQVEQKQSMPSWIWIAVIGGILLVVLLVPK